MADAYTKLLIHSDTTDGSTAFTDSGSTGHTITVNGNVHHETDQKKFGATSIAFDGSGDYLSVPDHADWNVGSGDFTIETWFMIPNVSGYKTIWASNSDFVLGALIKDSKMLYFVSTNGSSWNLIAGDANPYNGVGSITITANAWHHFVFVRSGNRWGGFIDGVLDLLVSASGTVASKNEVKNIGRWGNGSYYFSGYMDEFRFSKGIARWPLSFTPPSDIYSSAQSYDKLLIHSDTTDGSTTFTDSGSTGHTITVNGNVHHETDQKKFGATSIAFDGSGDYLSVPDHADWNVGSGNFTIETWFMIPNVSGYKTIWASTSDFVLGIFIKDSKVLYFVSTNGSSWNLIAGDASPYNGVGNITITANAWHHLVFVRDGSIWFGFVDGEVDLVLRLSGTVATKNEAKNIGRWGNGSYYFTGYMDEFRFCKGEAAYTLNFTPPTSMYDATTMLEDFSLDLAVQGYAFDNFKMILDVLSGDWTEDFSLNLDVVGQMIDSFKMLLAVALNKLDDFKMLLEVTDGTVFDDFSMLLDVTDGLVFDNFKMELSVVSATPAFRSVTAQRVSSVLYEV